LIWATIFMIDLTYRSFDDPNKALATEPSIGNSFEFMW
jgi:hypothetical protein